MQASAAKAEKALTAEADATRALKGLCSARDETHGAAASLQELHTHSTLPRGMAYVLTGGQAEGVRRKLSAFEDRCAKVERDRQAASDVSEPEQRRLQGANAAVELLSHLLALQVGRTNNPASSPSSSPTHGRPTPQSNSFKGSQTSSQRPSKDRPSKERPDSGERGGLGQVAAVALLGEMRVSAFEATEAATRNVERLQRVSTERASLESKWCAARGASKALGVMRTSLIRYKHVRLERRRQEALGLCIATAQAKVAHRHGKRTLSEIAGSRELLATLRQQHETLPLPTLELCITLPPGPKKNKGSRPPSPGGKGVVPPSPGGNGGSDGDDAHFRVANRLVDDCLAWMGWPDETLRYTRHVLRTDDKGVSVLAVSFTVAPVDELASSLGSSDPATVGARMLDEASSGRLLPGLINTATMLELGGINLASASLHVPTREELRAADPPLYQIEADVRAEMEDNELHIERATAQVEVVRLRDERIKESAATAANRRRMSHKPEPITVPTEKLVKAKASGGGAMSLGALDEESEQPNDGATVDGVGGDGSHHGSGDGSGGPTDSSGHNDSEWTAWGRNTNSNASADEAARQLVAEAAELVGRHETAGAISSNQVAINAVAALSFAATNPMHSLGNVQLADGASIGKWGHGGTAPMDSKLRFRMNFLAMTSPKARLIYARTHRDTLFGRLAAIDALRAHTTWGGVQPPDSSPNGGSTSAVARALAAGSSSKQHALVVHASAKSPSSQALVYADEGWNLGLGRAKELICPPAGAAGGAGGGKIKPPVVVDPEHARRFCIFCASCKMPPSLGRHMYVECYHRALAGEPQYSPTALASLESDLNKKEERTAMLLARFERQVEQRKAYKAMLDQTVHALRLVKRASAAEMRLDGDGIGLPGMMAPKSMRAAATTRYTGYNQRVRHVSKALAEDYSRASELLPNGEVKLSAVWSELKALLVLSPRRSLLVGGLAALAHERVLELDHVGMPMAHTPVNAADEAGGSEGGGNVEGAGGGDGGSGGVVVGDGGLFGGAHDDPQARSAVSEAAPFVSDDQFYSGEGMLQRATNPRSFPPSSMIADHGFLLTCMLLNILLVVSRGNSFERWCRALS